MTLPRYGTPLATFARSSVAFNLPVSESQSFAEWFQLVVRMVRPSARKEPVAPVKLLQLSVSPRDFKNDRLGKGGSCSRVATKATDLASPRSVCFSGKTARGLDSWTRVGAGGSAAKVPTGGAGCAGRMISAAPRT